MGTRNLTCVVVDGEFKVAQYCQWDGYPEGQGRTCLEFLHDVTDFHGLTEAFRRVQRISPEEYKAKWVECGADPEGDGWVTLDVADKFKQDYYHLHRDCGADILGIVDDIDGHISVRLDTDFARDALFCEWAYVVDLDDMTLSVYSGTSHAPDADFGHFKDLEPDEDDNGVVVRIAKFDLNDLPSTEEFLEHFLSLEEEDDE